MWNTFSNDLCFQPNQTKREVFHSFCFWGLQLPSYTASLPNPEQPSHQDTFFFVTISVGEKGI
jgi:hypothetical protein